MTQNLCLVGATVAQVSYVKWDTVNIKLCKNLRVFSLLAMAFIIFGWMEGWRWNEGVWTHLLIHPRVACACMVCRASHVAQTHNTFCMISLCVVSIAAQGSYSALALSLNCEMPSSAWRWWLGVELHFSPDVQSTKQYFTGNPFVSCLQ